MASIDWLKVKNEYITGNISYRKLAEKHNVSFNTLKDRAVSEKWKAEKDRHHNKVTTTTQQKMVEKTAEKEVDRLTRTVNLTDKLSEAVERAINEIDQYIVKNKKKTRVVEYKSKSAPGKPSKELIEEKEEIEVVPGMVDTLSLQQISSALKNIKDIQLVREEKKPKMELMQALLDLVEKDSGS